MGWYLQETNFSYVHICSDWLQFMGGLFHGECHLRWLVLSIYLLYNNCNTKNNNFSVIINLNHTVKFNKLPVVRRLHYQIFFCLKPSCHSFILAPSCSCTRICKLGNAVNIASGRILIQQLDWNTLCMFNG